MISKLFLLALVITLGSCGNACVVAYNGNLNSSIANLPRTSTVLVTRKALINFCQIKDNKEECSFVPLVGYGSGTIVYHHKNSSSILTAEHVCHLTIPEEVKQNIKFSLIMLEVTDIEMNKYIGKVVSFDKKNDMCIIETEKQINKPIAVLAAGPPTPGERIINIGSPNGFLKKDVAIIQEGTYDGEHDYEDGIRIGIFSLMTYGGASGSMIVNTRGEIIGMVHSAFTKAPIICRSPGFNVLKVFVNTYISSIVDKK